MVAWCSCAPPGRFHHGHASPADEAGVRRRSGEMFYPSSPRWRTQVMATTRDLWPVILERFARL